VLPPDDDAAMTPVAADVAEVEPAAFVAVTPRMSFEPTSEDVSRYVCAVAPEID
jgi:hypothetical protein